MFNLKLIVRADVNAVTDSGVTCLHFAAAITTGSAASKDGVEKLINLGMTFTFEKYS